MEAATNEETEAIAEAATAAAVTGAAAEAATAATAEAAVEAAAEALPFEAEIGGVSKYGNIILTISPDSMVELGYEVADVIRVNVGGQEVDMPIGTAYTNVDSGENLCYYKYSTDGGQDFVMLSINMGNLVESLNIGEIRSIEEAPGYECVWADGFDPSAPVEISMVEKQGYALEYEQHMYTSSRTNVREDYAHLSDEDYANFRAVSTTGMGNSILYRSSSPIDPSLNRNKEADQAMEKAQIKTVLNMAENKKVMTGYADYELTYYSGCDIIPLNMTISVETDDFSQRFAEGLRFLASHEGPYLIHCKEGKERTGFAIAVLECLMGASADEVVEDFMKTYYNFYNVEPGSENYTKIADSAINPILAEAFDVEAIDGEDVDLAKCAEDYLIRIGLTEEEITAVKGALGRDFDGMQLTE
ncbi:MAG: tyrosine-protein phosphatase [Eubacteriales bacterium]|nr:tyrosine-protein phosphatase [Eubacteriales bacterium]